MVNSVRVVPFLWPCLSPKLQMGVLVRTQVWLGDFGSKFRAYLFPIRYTTLYGACRKALPTKVNLAQRKVVLDNTYEACGLMAEFIGHVLWDCAKAQEAWSCSKLVGLFD